MQSFNPRFPSPCQRSLDSTRNNCRWPGEPRAGAPLVRNEPSILFH